MAANRPHKRPPDEPSGVTTAHSATALAATVRAIYVANYRLAHRRINGVATMWGDQPIVKWDGGDSDTGFHKPIWPKIAAVCLRAQIAPEQFIASQFVDCDTLPRPNHLLSDAAMERYREYAAFRGDEVAEALASQKQILGIKARQLADLLGLKINQAIESTLQSELVALSGLFRYCFAVSWRRDAIAVRYRESALRQYVFERAAYDASWGDFIPSELVASAEELARAAEDRPRG